MHEVCNFAFKGWYNVIWNRTIDDPSRQNFGTVEPSMSQNQGKFDQGKTYSRLMLDVSWRKRMQAQPKPTTNHEFTLTKLEKHDDVMNHDFIACMLYN